jgi:eukaryotic-like serine/threonine-protein kinase
MKDERRVFGLFRLSTITTDSSFILHPSSFILSFMTPQRWQQVKDLFQAARAYSTEQREAFLATACANDAALRQEVESLLAAHEQPGHFLDEPAVAAAWRDTAEAEASVGQLIGHYQVERRLGAGGMGVVYLARDTQLGRPAALKLLQANLTQDAARVRRFRQEARAASALNHPNILTIYEVGQADLTAGGAHFIAAEFVDGRTLREQCNAGGMTLGAALDLLVQVTSALTTAHEAGIVHRDIKPENLMLRHDGLVKVLDFGLAKLTEQAARPPSLSFARVTTQPGVVMGTVSYMSPEQARGLEVDARSDLFSLGVVMYELLTGHAPFAGETTSDVLVALLSGEPRPLARYSANLPDALQEMVNRALAKPVEQRYQTARELGADLKHLKEELSFAARLKGNSASRDDKLSMMVGATTEADEQTTFATQTFVTPPSAAPEAAGFTTRRVSLRQHGKWLALAALVPVLIAAVLGWQRFATRGKAIDSVAVLPFANVGDDPQMAYLADGLTESLIDNLLQLPALRVSAHSTIAGYKGREIDPRQAGKELQVRAVIMGRVAWQGERLIIRVELVDAADGSRVWGDGFQHTRSQIVTVQEEIAREIAAKLHRRLSPVSQQQLARRHSPDSKAYELYAQGRNLYLRNDRKSLEAALDYFRQAIALDPRYALAYCGVADVYSGFSSQYLPSSEVIPKAREAALKAIELDETLPEAHHSLALVKLWGNWDWAGAEREYKRALELNPNFVSARVYYAEFLADQQRFEEALREIKRAQESDPASLQALGREGYIYYQMRQYDRAIAVYRKILELRPDRVATQRDLALVLSQQGKHQEALALVSQFQRPDLPHTLSVATACIYARAGRRDEALKLLRELKARAERERVPPYAFARIYTVLGDKEQALACLRKVYDEQSDHLLHIGADPMLDPLRADPRFKALLRGTGLAR